MRSRDLADTARGELIAVNVLEAVCRGKGLRLLGAIGKLVPSL